MGPARGPPSLAGQGIGTDGHTDATQKDAALIYPAPYEPGYPMQAVMEEEEEEEEGEGYEEGGPNEKAAAPRTSETGESIKTK